MGWKSWAVACAVVVIPQILVTAEEKPTKIKDQSIVRSVLQPLGMPVVTSYHKMRESLFLNAKNKDSQPLEAAGNFFLAPSRYLFAGKNLKITEENKPCIVSQSFHYDKLHWLKTTLCLAVLPATDLVGATLKGLAYLSPEVRRHHRQLKAALRTPAIQSHEEEYKEKGIAAFHSEDYIPCQNFKRPSTLTKRQKIEIEALKDVVQLFEEHGIIYWIDCGTCLGSYRYGGIIPWDWDIDISILLPDHENVKRILSTLDRKKYQIQDWSSYTKPKSFLKLYVKQTKNFIDIYHYALDEEKKEVGLYYTYLDSPFPHSWKSDELKQIKPVKYEALFPLKKANFDGLTVWAPNDTVTFLQSKYESNLEPSNLWDEKRECYVKDPNHPYWKNATK